ncbi:MAG TPA: metallophosphoesterase family protein [Burkholderiales bacterium]|nr:metallophosphoesterase family protein [Burkholderiales bacterium]
MAVYGVLGDIHGNREALAAVLAFFNRRGVARVLCTGDLVGYNADPDACVALLRARNAFVIAGNHDLISVRRLGFARCSRPAEYALRRTRRRLAPGTAGYLGALPAWRTVGERILLVHGSVADVERRLATPAETLADAVRLRAGFPQVHVCFYGHLHAQKAFQIEGGTARELEGDTLRLRPEYLYYVNPGSVDAARKRAPRFAECALFDDVTLELEFHRLAYDERGAERRAAACGYRIGPWMDRYYALRRRIRRGFMVRRD